MSTQSFLSRGDTMNDIATIPRGISLRTVFEIYDLMHYFCVNGDHQVRETVIDYLYRAKPYNHERSKQTQLRFYERFKQHLQRLDIKYSVEIDYQQGATKSILYIHHPRKEQQKLSVILDAPRRKRPPKENPEPIVEAEPTLEHKVLAA